MGLRRCGAPGRREYLQPCLLHSTKRRLSLAGRCLHSEHTERSVHPLVSRTQTDCRQSPFYLGFGFAQFPCTLALLQVNWIFHSTGPARDGLGRVLQKGHATGQHYQQIIAATDRVFMICQGIVPNSQCAVSNSVSSLPAGQPSWCNTPYADEPIPILIICSPASRAAALRAAGRTRASAPT